MSGTPGPLPPSSGYAGRLPSVNLCSCADCLRFKEERDRPAWIAWAIRYANAELGTPRKE